MSKNLETKYYTDDAFIEKFKGEGVTLGNIRLLRSALREAGEIKTRQKLGDNHMEKFREAAQLKESQQLSWDQAFQIAVGEEATDGLSANDLIEDLKEISDKIKYVKSLSELERFDTVLTEMSKMISKMVDFEKQKKQYEDFLDMPDGDRAREALAHEVYSRLPEELKR